MKRNIIATDFDSNKTVVTPACFWHSSKRFQCVYKILFDDYFYFGSTVDLKERFGRHLLSINNPKSRKSKLMVEAFNNCNTIKLEIVEMVDDLDRLRDLEAYYISKNISNSKIINKRMPVKVLVGQPCIKAKLIAYNRDGTHTYYNSIAEASRLLNEREEKIRANIKRGYRVSGILIRKIDKKGNPIIVEKTLKKRGNKKGCKTKPCKDIYCKKTFMYDLNGNVINEFRSISDAAKSVGSKVDTFRKAIKRSPNNFTKGYIFKYA